MNNTRIVAQAKAIQNLIDTDMLKPEEVPDLERHGISHEAVQYWKDNFQPKEQMKESHVSADWPVHAFVVVKRLVSGWFRKS